MSTTASSPSLRDRISDSPPVVRRLVLVDFITGQLTEALGAGEGEEIHARSRFEDLGIDSKMALEFKEYLEQELGCALETTLMFDYPTPERLAGYIIDHVLQLGGGHGNGAQPAPAAAAASPADAAEGDIEEQMRRKLEKYQM